MAFKHVGVTLEFKGSGSDEKAYVKTIDAEIYSHIISSTADKSMPLHIGQEVLSIDPKYYRPTEVDVLLGDPTKAKEKLGWVPEYDLAALVEDMMRSDVKLMQKEKFLKGGGYERLESFE